LPGSCPRAWYRAGPRPCAGRWPPKRASYAAKRRAIAPAACPRAPRRAGQQWAKPQNAVKSRNRSRRPPLDAQEDARMRLQSGPHVGPHRPPGILQGNLLQDAAQDDLGFHLGKGSANTGARAAAKWHVGEGRRPFGPTLKALRLESCRLLPRALIAV